MRLFVAIELPGEVREALGRLQHELQRRGLEKLRWVRPEGIHLTLKFLGETPAERVPAIEEALAGAANVVPRHELFLRHTGAFGRGRRIQVVFVHVGPSPPVQLLQRQIEKALQRRGFPREDREFSAHLTVARVRPETARDLAGVIPAALSAVRVPDIAIPVREVSLMRSILRPSGAVYERVAAFPLGGA